MKVAIIVGHSILKNGTCTSAKGEVLEYSYCKELAPIVQKYLKSKGHTGFILTMWYVNSTEM